MTADSPLTARQREVLWAMYDHQVRHGQPPALRELMAALGISSPNGIMSHVSSLLAKGYLTRAPGKNRGYLLCGLAVMIEDSPAGARPRAALGGGGQ